MQATPSAITGKGRERTALSTAVSHSDFSCGTENDSNINFASATHALALARLMVESFQTSLFISEE
jgi:hypothetical protein